MKSITSVLAITSFAMATGISFATHKEVPRGEFWSYPHHDAASAAAIQHAPKDIDLAICLDTSGSMGGLIESAKQRLWALVNDLGKAEPAPRLRIAVLAYGSPLYGADNGWVKTLVPLTTDLDMVSNQLFALQTNGGDEYVARVADAATKQLQWSSEPGALKMIVVAGNESAEQDPLLTLEQAMGVSSEQGILVHALYCREGGSGGQQYGGIQAQLVSSIGSVGPVAASAPTLAVPLDGIALGWKKIATLAGGAFAMIDQNDGVIVVETPYDDRLIGLSTEINRTYIPYGAGADWNRRNQTEQDINSVRMNNEAAASRAQTKGGKLYFCSWDLVDALTAGEVEIDKVDKELLAEGLRELSVEELGTLVEEKRKERKRIQSEIDVLGQLRDAFIVKKHAELDSDESEAFDSVLRKAFRTNAETKGFRFPKVAAAPESEASIIDRIAPVETVKELKDQMDGC